MYGFNHNITLFLNNNDDHQLQQDSEGSSEDEEFDVTKVRGPLREWVVLERPRRHIRRQFKTFLLTHEDEKHQLVYPSRIEVRLSFFIINVMYYYMSHHVVMMVSDDCEIEMMK